MSNERKEVALVTLGPLALCAVLWVAFSYMEARAYERVTGKQVTTWDAMFLDLRVQEGAR